MRSNNLLLLASLASYALALPADLDRRTGLVSDVVGDVTGLVDMILGGGTSPATLLSGISAPAAAALEGGALGCKAGSVRSSARKDLAKWIHSNSDAFHASVVKSLLGWCDGAADAVLPVDVTSVLSMLIPTAADKAAQGSLVVTLDGVFDAAEFLTDVVLNSSAQSSLTSFLQGTVGSLLDSTVKSALSLCANGGSASDLSQEIQSALHQWLTGSDCQLASSLKSSVLAWLQGKAEGDAISLGSLPTGGLSVISAGAAVESLVGEAGVLVESAQMTLAAILKSDVVSGVEDIVISALTSCSKGAHASALSWEARTALAKWLASSDCRLGAEHKSLALLWMSYGITGDAININVPGGLVSDLTSFITGTVDSLLGTHLSGILSLLTSGDSLITLSIGARSQLASVCGGAAGIEIDTFILEILIGWLTGCDLVGGGSSAPSSSMAIPTSSVPVIASSSGAAAASSTPCDTLTSESVTPIATSTEATGPTGTPSAPEASSTPCDTITSSDVVPVSTSTEAVGPTGTPSVPVIPTPASSAPESSSTPCDTITSEDVVPVSTSTEATGPTGTPSVPVVPTPVSPAPEASSTPCDTITSEDVVPVSTSTEAVGPTGTPSVPVVPTPQHPLRHHHLL
ncbi:hypothetical protein BDV59DRAFT_197928 [Aspergillus ambiguus]|uniref:putative cell wall protein n=1 Tax=Aspergillus ambiguus TaxID=176160 RepID=UPI003CCD4018